MIVLAFDTSVTGCSVCLTDGKAAFSEAMATDRGQAEHLVPMIDSVLKNSGYGYAQIDRIGVTVGPGSFTGVRVGLSTAKALGLSLNKPVAGVSTLEVIAASSARAEDTLVLIDTKRGDFYGQVFDSKGPKDTARIWSPDEVENCALPKIQDAVPDVTLLAKLASAMEVETDTYNPLHAPNPLYLRGAEVSQSKRVLPKIIKTLDGAG